MDKQTLSNYGWLVIVTLILAVMLALATPFGNYVGEGVASVANGFVGTANNATDEDGIKSNENIWEAKLEHGITGNVKSYYFSTIEDAVEAINNNDYTTTTGNKKDDIMIIMDENTPILKLQNDIHLQKKVFVSKSCVIDLSGHTIFTEDSCLVFEETAIIKICNGTMYKSITDESSTIASLYLYDNITTTIDKMSFNMDSNTKRASAQIITASGQQFITIKNSNFTAIGTTYQANGNNTNQMFNFYSYNNDSVVNIENTNMNMTSALSMNVYCYDIGAINIKNSNITTTEIIDIELDGNWTSYSVVVAHTTLDMNNSKVVMNSVYANSTSAITVQGTTATIRNSHIESNTQKNETATSSFSYALQPNYETVVDIYNCDVIVNSKYTQASAVRCQSTGVFTAYDSNLIVNCDLEDNAKNAMFIGYTLFMNGEGENEIHTKNCFVKGEVCVYCTYDFNTYTEENTRYEALDKIYFKEA